MINNTELFELLKNIGVELSPTLTALISSNPTIYTKLLKLFEVDKSYLNFKKAYLEGDHKEAFHHAHTLKGILSNLCYIPFAQLITEITEDLRNNKDGNITEKIEKCDVYYDKIHTIIKNYL